MRRNQFEGTGYPRMRGVSSLYSPCSQHSTQHMPMAQPSRVLILIPHLGGGGAEQVTSLLARALSPEKYELHLGLVTQASADPEAMPSWVQVHALGAPRVRA